ncbi:hypothetical protein PanWU01x14_080600 [Parasponia andersonii]|uniref:Uncharacterized protein n=1 Tax=Parasponia andersonii TaxID=3476 RepID=A0A2P5DAT1_PARAD|nr:hypothetical protein PanWU01x14_080600 [Parasponia andersonii]
MLQPTVVLHQENDTVRQVVHVQKLPQRAPGPPNDNLLTPPHLGLVKPPHQRGEHVRVLRVKVVVGAVQVGGHSRDGVPAVLDPVRLAHLDPGDLGHGVPLVGGLQGAREEGIFGNWLRGEFWVDAGGAQEEELPDAVAVRGVDDVGLDLEVHGDEVGRVGVVGVDPAYLGGREDHESGPFGGEEGVNFALAGEIELGVGSEDQVGIA